MGINHLLNGMILQVPLFLWGISIHLPHWARHGVRGPQATQFTSPLWAKSLGFGLGKHLGGWRYDVGGPQKHTIQTPHLHLRRYDWKIRECVTWKFLIHISTFPAEHVWNRSQQFWKFLELPEQNSPIWSKIRLKPCKISSKYRKNKLVVAWAFDCRFSVSWCVTNSFTSTGGWHAGSLTLHIYASYV